MLTSEYLVSSEIYIKLFDPGFSLNNDWSNNGLHSVATETFNIQILTII